VELQAAEVSLDTQARKLQVDLATIRSDHLKDYNLTHIKVQATIDECLSEIEATKREFHSRLEETEAMAKQGREPGVCTSTAQPPIFDETTSWAVFQRQFETVAEHNHWSPQDKSTYLISLQRSGHRHAIRHSNKHDL
jgi:hypothetical protein